ncbi:MAG: XdhC family protein, partial [Comamonas sp.]
MAVAQGAVCLVEVTAIQGSAPRGPGAWMAVQTQELIGTIGGGHLEWEA